MKHICLPTDFSIRSLQPIHEVMKLYARENVKITLVHLVQPPAGINDLLFRTSSLRRTFPVPHTFLEACEVMANRYAHRITSICPVIRYGSTAAFLDNLLEALQVETVFYQSGFIERSPFPQSIPLLPLLNRSRHHILETPAAEPATPGMCSVADLLQIAG